MAWREERERYDPFGLETPFAGPPGRAPFFQGEAAAPRTPPPGPPPPAGAGVTFPSGLVLGFAAGATGPGDEHYDPNGADLPLLDTGPAVQDLAIAANFTVREFVTSGGRAAPVARISPDLVAVMQAIRDRAGKPVTITSGYRSFRRNKAVYKARGEPATNSRHSSGQAVDLKIAGMDGVALAQLAIDAAGRELGLGLGPDYVHVDVRGAGAMWRYKGTTARQLAAVRAHARAAQGGSAAPAPVPAPVAPARRPAPAGADRNRLVIRRLKLLAGHKGTHPDLILRWNDIAQADAVDVVVHFHGYADRRGVSMSLPADMEAVSGLDLADPQDPTIARTRPTITVLPRGSHFVTKEHPGAYAFPALTAAGGLDRLIAESMKAVGGRFGKSFTVGRLILTAHSGGGAALRGALAQVDPDEIHLFDATYKGKDNSAETVAAPFLTWAQRRIARELQKPQAVPPAMRILFHPAKSSSSGTGPVARRISDGLCQLLTAQGAARLSPRFRVDQTSVGHMEIPPRFGPRLLADAGASLPGATTLACPTASHEAPEGEELDWLAYEGAVDEAECEADFESGADEEEWETDEAYADEEEAGFEWPGETEADSEDEEEEEEAGEEEALADADEEAEQEADADEALDLEEEEEALVDGEAPLWRHGAKTVSRTAVPGADIVGIVRDDGTVLVAVNPTGKRVLALDAARVGTLEVGGGRPLHRCRAATLRPLANGAPDVLTATVSGPIVYALADGVVLLRLADKEIVGVAEGDLPAALLATLNHGTRIVLDGRVHQIWMRFRLRDERAETSRWVPAKATAKNIENRLRTLTTAAARLSAADRARVEPDLALMATVSVVEGGSGEKSKSWDSSVSLGIFQWAMTRTGTEAGSLGRFFRKLKERAAAGAEPLHVRAWQACTAQGLDVRGETLTLNGTIATGAQVEAALVEAMGGDDLSSYQLVAAQDWIDAVAAAPITPGPNGKLFLGHKWTVSGANEARLETTEPGASRTLVVRMPGAATVGQAFASQAALAGAVMLGVNRESNPRLALWRALGGSADPVAEVDRLLGAVVAACVAAGQVPNGNRPFTETQVNAAGAAAQAAYAALQRFLAPPVTLPAGGEAALRAGFESKAMLLYPPADARKHKRERRFATVRVRFP